MIPGLIGTAVYQINVFVDTIFASFLPKRKRVLSLLCGPADGISSRASSQSPLEWLPFQAFPDWPRRGRMEELKETLSFTFRLVSFISIPAMVGLISLKDPHHQSSLSEGEFDARATMMTAKALLCYSVGLWAIAGARTIVPAFYSLQDTWTPLKIGLICLVANVRLYCHLHLSPETCGFGPGDEPLLHAQSHPSLLEIESETGRVESEKDCPVLSADTPLQPTHGRDCLPHLFFRGLVSGGPHSRKDPAPRNGIGAGLGVYLMCSYGMKNEEMLFLLKMARKKR